MYLGTPESPQTESFLALLPSGPEGVKATLNIMRALVRAYKKIPTVRNFAATLVSRAPQKDYRSEVKALHEFVRDRIRYVRDIRGVETIQTPEKTLQLGFGDCDDKSTLLATLLEAIGHPTRFVAVSKSDPGTFTHVYVETRIGDKWIGLETTEPVAMGWKPRGIVARMVVNN
jgi:transglutaminase-like putative cysteine protease